MNNHPFPSTNAAVAAWWHKTLTALAAFFLFACNNGPDKPDVSGIQVSVALNRFEKDFFAIDTNNLSPSLTALNRKYPRFYPTFANDILFLYRDHQILPDGQVVLSDTGALVFRSFFRDYLRYYQSIEEKYKNLNWLKKDLEEAFRYVKYYYPAYPVPELITFIGSFDAPGAIITPKYLGVGLHQYGGRSHPAYADPVIQQVYPGYIARRFDREYILPNCIKAVIDDIYPDTSLSLTLVEQMVEKGKQWWLAGHFLPDLPDSLITGYTKKQMEWIKENEGNIWTSILTGAPNLYTVEPDIIKMYIGESPTTMGMPAASPGNIGQWVGWRIVEAFAERNPGMKLQEVLATPARRIFQEAKYKPK